jgi:hypothetical protein
MPASNSRSRDDDVAGEGASAARDVMLAMAMAKTALKRAALRNRLKAFAASSFSLAGKTTPITARGKYLTTMLTGMVQILGKCY